MYLVGIFDLPIMGAGDLHGASRDVAKAFDLCIIGLNAVNKLRDSRTWGAIGIKVFVRPNWPLVGLHIGVCRIDAIQSQWPHTSLQARKGDIADGARGVFDLFDHCL